MSCYAGPEITDNNLILCYDMLNTQKSFLGEPTTNFVSAPEDLSNAVWDKTSYPTTITSNATEAPTGTMAADLAVNANTNPCLYFQSISTTTTGTGQLTTSVYAKYHSATYFTLNCYYVGDGEVNINFNLTTGTCDAGGTMSYVGNGWYLCSHQIPTRVNAGTTVLYRIWPGGRGLTNTLGCYFWGHQLEAKSYVTPYTSSSRSNTQTLIDLTNTKTITANNLTYSSNNTFSFNGSNNHIWIGDLGTFPSTGTIDFWMNSSEVVNYRNPFHTNYTGTGNNVGIRFEQYTGGGFNVVVGNDADTYAGGIITSSLQANTWYNVVVTWNTSTNTLTGYLNSVIRFTTSHTYWATTLSKVAVGVGYNSIRYFKGSIPKINIYNTALSASEIQQNFNALRSRFGL